MFKKIIVLCLLLLCSCSNKKQVACILEKEDKSITLEIEAINDDIYSIKQRVVFELPNNVLANETYLNDLNKQLDDSYHFEDNLLVNESFLNFDNTYSLSKTIEYLRKEKFYCE